MIAAVMPTYARTGFALEKGEGMYVWTDGGRRLLDLGAGIAVTALGHAHPKLTRAIQDQAAKLLHCSNLYQIQAQTKAAELLVANTFADSVFFCNSGAEANECGVKIARKYQTARGNAEKYRVICCDGAFHGRTLATLAAGGQPKHLEGFGPVTDGFDHVAFGNLNEMRAAVNEKTAGILVEPVQGEGGVRPAPEGYLEGLRAICDEFDLLMMVDEVQCGNGRTGRLYAYQWSDAAPDVLTTAKGLGGGFPVGACLANEKAAAAMVAGTHGSTYGGNPMSATAAAAVLEEILADGFLEKVREIACYLWGGLTAVADRHPAIISEIRGKGLMVGLKCSDVENSELVAALLDAGVLTVPAGDNVVRMVPPLIMEKSHADEAAEALEAACRALEDKNKRGAA